MSPAGRGLGATLLVVLALTHAGLSLRCFNCDSTQDSRCHDHFVTSYHSLKDCEQDRRQTIGDEPFCMKQVYIDGGGPQFNKTIRMCAWASPKEPQFPCQMRQQMGKSLLYCSVCNKDACNGARGSASPSTVLYVLPAVFAALSKTP